MTVTLDQCTFPVLRRKAREAIAEMRRQGLHTRADRATAILDPLATPGADIAALRAQAEALTDA